MPENQDNQILLKSRFRPSVPKTGRMLNELGNQVSYRYSVPIPRRGLLEANGEIMANRLGEILKSKDPAHGIQSPQRLRRPRKQYHLTAMRGFHDTCPPAPPISNARIQSIFSLNPPDLLARIPSINHNDDENDIVSTSSNDFPRHCRAGRNTTHDASSC